MYTTPKHQSMRSFGAAATICGILSLTLACCGLSIPFAAAGLLFTILAERRVGPRDGLLTVSKVFNIVGLAVGIFVLVYFCTQLSNPEFMAQLNATSQALYGMDFQEMLNAYRY